MHSALEPFEPTRAEPFDRDAAAHLWRRAGFGAPRALLDETLGRKPAEAVEAIVTGPRDDPAERDLESIYGVVLGRGDADAARAWLIGRMARCRHQLREKLALFWHGHFATSIRKVRKVDWMMRQYRLLLRLGTGRFATLLDAVTRDPAMIRWLDNETNSKGQPNENYARELFELFTLGVGNYTEHDIRESARAFTGWHILRDQFHLSRAQHDDGVKTVLGTTGPLGGEDVCRIALEQPACSRFLARKLLAYFVRPDPDPDVVDAFGDALRGEGYDLSGALRLLFGSRYFFARAHRRTLVKSPLEFVVGAARALEIRLDATAAVPWLREMGQDLLAPPNVKGWPGHTDWIDTARWLIRVDAARALAGAFEAEGPFETFERTLLGRPAPAAERALVVRSGAGRRDLAHALLSLPEAHLA